jgi:hypothetical protein
MLIARLVKISSGVSLARKTGSRPANGSPPPKTTGNHPLQRLCFRTTAEFRLSSIDPPISLLRRKRYNLYKNNNNQYLELFFVAGHWRRTRAVKAFCLFSSVYRF